LSDELLDLRKEIASSQQHAKVKLPSKDVKEDFVPNNVKRLRNELALARARLAAARDQSVSLDKRAYSAPRSMVGSPTSQSQASSPDRSEDSMGSSWLPPGVSGVDPPEQLTPMTAKDKKQSSKSPTRSVRPSPERGRAPLPASTRNPYLGKMQGHQSALQIAESNSLNGPRLKIEVNLEQSKQLLRELSPARGYRNGTTPSPRRDLNAVSSESCGNSVASEVQKTLELQLEESNRRLQQANSRLKGLGVDSRTSRNRPSPVSYKAVKTPSRIQQESRSSTQPKIYNEVVTSESGSIEVTHHMFADV